MIYVHIILMFLIDQYTLTNMSVAETSTVTDSFSGERSALPTSKPASRAAPTAMTSSGGAELRSSTSGNISRIICWRRGIRAEPPQRTTWNTAITWKACCAYYQQFSNFLFFNLKEKYTRPLISKWSTQVQTFHTVFPYNTVFSKRECVYRHWNSLERSCFWCVNVSTAHFQIVTDMKTWVKGSLQQPLARDAAALNTSAETGEVWD